MRLKRKAVITIAAATTIGLALTGCVGDEAADTSNIDCSPYESYGTFDGAEVSISGTIVEAEADRLVESWVTAGSDHLQSRHHSLRRDPPLDPYDRKRSGLPHFGTAYFTRPALHRR